VKPQMNLQCCGNICPGWYAPPVIRRGIEETGETVFGFSSNEEGWRCPYGAPGDSIWVRETWHANKCLDDISPSMIVEEALEIGYAYNKKHPACDLWYSADQSYRPWSLDATSSKGKTRVSIHMPRWASRIMLEVTEVRVERLNSITVQDALDEGIVHHPMNDPRVEFQHLWESINGDGSWADNPWVWCIEFSRGAICV